MSECATTKEVMINWFINMRFRQITEFKPSFILSRDLVTNNEINECTDWSKVDWLICDLWHMTEQLAMHHWLIDWLIVCLMIITLLIDCDIDLWLRHMVEQLALIDDNILIDWWINLLINWWKLINWLIDLFIF